MNTQEYGATETSDARSFPDRLRAACDRLSRICRAGVTVGKGEDKVYRDRRMEQETFDLACDLHAKGLLSDHLLWAHWMMDAAVRRSSQGISIYHRSKFFAEESGKRFGKLIEQHTGIRPRFFVDESIRARVTMQ